MRPLSVSTPSLRAASVQSLRQLAHWAKCALIACVTVSLAACAGSEHSPREPIAVGSYGNDLGTLISASDVAEVSAEMIASLDQSSKVRAIRSEQALTIRIDRFRHLTTITNFDKDLFLNHLLGHLTEAGQGRYRFLDRDSVARERDLQKEGWVTGTPPEKLKGAEWVLSGDIREILHREPNEDGSETEKRSVHYSLRLVRVSDGEVAWSHAMPIVKQQVIGLVYR